MFDILANLYNNSGLSDLFDIREKDDKRDRTTPYVSYRVKPNIYKIRAFEVVGTENDFYFRIYHATDMVDDLRESLGSIEGFQGSTKKYLTVFKTADYHSLTCQIKNLLLNKDIIKICKESSSVARMSRFEGLELPNVDTSIIDVMGMTFKWKEIIKIWEDNSEDNYIKKVLSQKGIYIQRSEDGTSRYIGSAYGSGGILERWVNHLNSLGDAHHLNLFVLEKGYNEVIFSVIEFYEGADIIKREGMWKQILGTVNVGPYNGIQLNRN
ncbi:GIY-YIG nuclease family protein [Metabacillus litoralis]|uniref:GIY-YIG nuclease family protein n=1 Tax=Metabacillus TaxID=2675233 RepID=UPI001BA08501|nr:GIY-YIG nuclease family protein [Metabacillus litoralis]UHA61438.1 GIY-YIG nuclease family protein [Metabacillus litoralis]